MFGFGKKKVPDELPDLAMDELYTEVTSPAKQTEKKYKSLTEHSLSSQLEKFKVQPKQQISVNDEKGFFKDIVKGVTAEIENIEKFEEWYQKKFLPGDIVNQMREYWEKQSPEMLLRSLDGPMKNKLLEKTEKLHQLEKEWQQSYFALIAKEEEIRREEKELKEALAEFISIFKNSANRRK